MKKLKNQATAIAVAALMITACNSEPNMNTTDLTPIEIGTIEVSGAPKNTQTRTETPWMDQYNTFAEGDLLTLFINGAETTTYQHLANRTWTPDPRGTQTMLYLENIAAGDVFTASKGYPSLQVVQDMLSEYHQSDYICGTLELTGNTLNTPSGSPMAHQHVDVVINVLPGDVNYWGGLSFVEHMKAADVRFYTKPADGSQQITPYTASITPQMATYRAIIPANLLPGQEEPIISISHPGVGPVLGRTYDPDPVPAGTRLTITMAYDNKRLIKTSIELNDWTGDYQYTNTHAAYDMIIRTEADLVAFRDNVNAENQKLTAIQVADITLTETNWTPIGNTYPYKGIYYGNNHTITGLNIAGSLDNRGLFGKIENATLSSINLIAPNVKGKDNVGALAGNVPFGTFIVNCTATNATVNGTNNVGGLVGFNNGWIIACHANATVNGNTGTAGAFAGINSNVGDISFCHATGTVSATTAGGLVGTNYQNIISCYTTATAADGTTPTPLVGDNQNAAQTTHSHDATKPGTPGDVVRAATGFYDVRIAINSVRKIDKKIWSEGTHPVIEWNK